MLSHMMKCMTKPSFFSLAFYLFCFLGASSSSHLQLQYNSIDTSPLSKYVMHPFWNQTVKLIPLWVAPNLLTFTGFLFVILVAVIISYYDPDFSASADTLPQSSPIPQWVWLACAVFHFLAHTLDGIDGKQARKTGTSGPVGELFDHGLDSWTSLFTPFCIYSIFGRADYAFSPFRVQFIFWAVFLSFYFSHWEKYNTGILYLPWAYDITQLILLILYILTGLHGHSMWKFSLTIVPLTSGNIFELLTHIGAFAFSIPVSLYNVYLAYQANTLKQKSFGEALRPFVPLGVLICITVGWSIYSPNHVLDAQPRLFFLMTGTIFSNIAVSNSQGCTCYVSLEST